MIWPELVPKRLCTTDCRVKLYGEGVNEDGAPMVLLDAELKCNYQDKAKTVYTKEQKLVTITGTAYFNGDIAPKLPVISAGEFSIFGVIREIQQGTKARNPDGSVNYTVLEVV